MKTGCCYTYENQLIWEPDEFEKNKYLITSPKSNYIYTILHSHVKSYIYIYLYIYIYIYTYMECMSQTIYIHNIDSNLQIYCLKTLALALSLKP
jgi:hypothetical protein